MYISNEEGRPSNVGDIVYFGSEYISRDQSMWDDYSIKFDYIFKPGDRYRINSLNSITNLENGVTYTVCSDHWDKIITKEQWREIQINNILDS